MQRQSIELSERAMKDAGEFDYSLPDDESATQAETMQVYRRSHERALIRKVDYRLLPILGALYAISLVDRVNVCSHIL